MKFVNKLIKEPGPEPLTPSESLLWALLKHVLGPLGWLFVAKAKESYVPEDYGEWGDADKEEFKRLMDAKRQSGH
jgi:hypothetical protein